MEQGLPNRGDAPEPADVPPTHQRPGWDAYFMELVATVSRRATCDRGRSGCVIVRDKRIVCTGYVGSPPGMPHCDEAGHEFARAIDDNGSERTHCVRTIHAEQNALVQAARLGLPLEGATLYCTMEPCRACAMMIVGSGIVRVVAGSRYHAAGPSRAILEAAGVQLDVESEDSYLYRDAAAPS